MTTTTRAPGRTPTTGPARILLVEDPTSAGSVRRGLLAQGVDVDARDAAAGLHAALTGGYDVIVLDLAAAGFELCDRIRAGVGTPVMMLSARDAEDDVVDAFARGVDAYVTKPVSPPVLVARIHALVRRGVPRTGRGSAPTQPGRSA